MNLLKCSSESASATDYPAHIAPQIIRQTVRHTDSQSDKKTDIQTDSQTERQTDRKTGSSSYKLFMQVDLPPLTPNSVSDFYSSVSNTLTLITIPLYH